MVHFVPGTAQVELKSGRVYAPAHHRLRRLRRADVRQYFRAVGQGQTDYAEPHHSVALDQKRARVYNELDTVACMIRFRLTTSQGGT
jgi:hypothetical protein